MYKSAFLMDLDYIQEYLTRHGHNNVQEGNHIIVKCPYGKTGHFDTVKITNWTEAEEFIADRDQ